MSCVAYLLLQKSSAAAWKTCSFFFSCKKAGSNSSAEMDVRTIFFFAFFEMSNVIIVGKDPGRKRMKNRFVLLSELK